MKEVKGEANATSVLREELRLEGRGEREIPEEEEEEEEEGRKEGVVREVLGRLI